MMQEKWRSVPNWWLRLEILAKERVKKMKRGDIVLVPTDFGVIKELVVIAAGIETFLGVGTAGEMKIFECAKGDVISSRKSIDTIEGAIAAFEKHMERSFSGEYSRNKNILADVLAELQTDTYYSRVSENYFADVEVIYGLLDTLKGESSD